MSRSFKRRSNTRLEVILSVLVVVLLTAVIVETFQPNSKSSAGSAVFCRSLKNLHGSNRSGSDLVNGVYLSPGTILCEGQKVIGLGIQKGTVIEAALATGRPVGIVLLSKPTTKGVATFSTLTLRAKEGWFGDNGYFAAVGNNGLGYSGTQLNIAGVGGSDDGGD